MISKKNNFKSYLKSESNLSYQDKNQIINALDKGELSFDSLNNKSQDDNSINEVLEKLLILLNSK